MTEETPDAMEDRIEHEHAEDGPSDPPATVQQQIDEATDMGNRTVAETDRLSRANRTRRDRKAN